MNPLIFFKGFLIGVILSIPPGPIALVCIRRSLMQGFCYGFFSGLGAATADVLYSFIAVFGLTIASSMLTKYKALIQIITGIFLCYLGIHIFLSKISNKNTIGWANGLIASYASAFFLTLSNPATLIAFMLAFSVLEINIHTLNIIEAAMLMLGVCMGAIAWWMLISLIAYSMRTKITMNIMHKINTTSGIIIFLFGIFTLLGSLNL